MVEIEIKKLTKRQAGYLKPHLESEHRITRGKIEIEDESKDRKHKLLATIFTGEF